MLRRIAGAIAINAQFRSNQFIRVIALETNKFVTTNASCITALAIVAIVAAAVGSAQQPPKAVTKAARPLPLSAVRLTGGPLKHAQDLDADYLLKLEPDRMMAYYRKRAGLEPKAQGYGGWDGDGRNLTGH